MPDAKEVYFASDTNEPTKYLTTESPWATVRSGQLAVTQNLTTDQIRNQVPNIITRSDLEQMPLHFDSKKHRNDDPRAMFPLFVDLWVLGHAKCMAHGPGGFSRYAASLTGNYYTCRAKAYSNGNFTTLYCPQYLNRFGLNLERREVIPH